MKFEDWWYRYYDLHRTMMRKESHRLAYIAGQQDMKDEMDLPAIIVPVKVAYVLCDNCEQYHKPDKPCAVTEGSR